MVEPKQKLREEVWETLEETGDDRFPGAQGRIPNFKGRSEAADRLTQTEEFQSASAIKINPDSPQTPVRERALEAGKILYMAVPKLRDRKCFLELDPDGMSGDPSDWSSIKGATQHGQPIHPSEMNSVDLIVTGAVAVDPEGHRLGKGGGYSDLEFAILVEYGLVPADVPILTTIHPVQELEPGRIPAGEQDLSLSGYSSPEKTRSIEAPLPRPEGLDRDRLTDEQLESIPIIQDLLDQGP
ncbi:MAG: 5-formyltetrahydrofolate cyclo-ligase [bacterium]